MKPLTKLAPLSRISVEISSVGLEKNKIKKVFWLQMTKCQMPWEVNLCKFRVNFGHTAEAQFFFWRGFLGDKKNGRMVHNSPICVVQTLLSNSNMMLCGRMFRQEESFGLLWDRQWMSAKAGKLPDIPSDCVKNCKLCQFTHERSPTRSQHKPQLNCPLPLLSLSVEFPECGTFLDHHQKAPHTLNSLSSTCSAPDPTNLFSSRTKKIASHSQNPSTK